LSHCPNLGPSELTTWCTCHVLSVGSEVSMKLDYSLLLLRERYYIA
jgi:hypothetical protein